MTYTVTANCEKCKYTDCVEVCPVEAFHEGPDMLYIHPETCIDCNACVEECPVEAIYPDGEMDDVEPWLGINTKYSETWPNITRKGETPADAKEWADVKNKYENHFSEKPGDSKE